MSTLLPPSSSPPRISLVVVVQALLGVLVIGSLLLKRQREKPKRPWRIWLFDVSKQVVGQMFVHGVNVFISDVGSTRSSGNACVFYFLNILIDTTLGVGAIYLALHLLTWLFTDKLQFKGFQSGQYGSPPSLNYWARQAAVYVVSLTSMKIFVVILLAWRRLLDIGAWLLSWLGNGDTAQVVFTMGLFPIFMNVVQFWLIDSIVKASGNTETALPFDQSDREPLFHSSDGDGDDGDGDDARGVGDAIATPAKRDIEAQTQGHDDSAAPPRSPMPPALNSPDPSSEISPAGADADRRPKEDWQSWDGEGDWVERVGEEEWTGRRAEVKKGDVEGRWRGEHHDTH
ncbi:vacuolar membrane protein-domain-containing protein [Russula aff. rugulosa BPL654]|nr:vacuolar membrane protein-domain-containing protein [Russula aff. rugulosa BPL654]